LSTTTLKPLATASFVAATHFCHVFSVSCITAYHDCSLHITTVSYKSLCSESAKVSGHLPPPSSAPWSPVPLSSAPQSTPPQVKGPLVSYPLTDVGRIGLGPRLVGWIASGVRVSCASFQKIACLVGRLESEPRLVGRIGLGVWDSAIFRKNFPPPLIY